MSSTPNMAGSADHTPQPSGSGTSSIDLSRLPPELRLKIWSSAVEPRMALFNDLMQSPRSYPLPEVTQLNAESRSESRRGYEAVGRGSYFHFERDILVCDYRLADQTSCSPAAEKLAERVERVVFWDCVPDDERIEKPHRYREYLSTDYEQKRFGHVVLDRFRFPNVKDFWSVKIGDIDKNWMVKVDKNAPHAVRLQQSAREFRYWVDENIIEIAPLDLNEPETRMVLREGRCWRGDCRDVNSCRRLTVSKITFMDGKYREPTDGRGWTQVTSASTNRRESSNSRAKADRMRWALVERSLTFFLRWDWPSDPAGNSRRRKGPT